MRLVDTSAWIEWLKQTPHGQALAPELPEPDQWIVPTIVQFELAKWLTREVGESAADSVIAFTRTCVVADLDTSIALLAADTSARRRLAAADAVVYASAQRCGADLLTCDSHFELLPGVCFRPN